jgi:CheY-like chemotaxis protein
MEAPILKYLRDALNNLYDSEHLRTNPLAQAIGKTGRGEPSLSLKKALESLIDRLKPKAGDTNRSQKRRMYELLYSRYIDQFSQKEVADQLGVSLSTYQREQRQALEFLAAVLMEVHPEISTITEGLENHHTALTEKNQADASILPSGDFSWMVSATAMKVSNLEDVLENVLPFIQPLAERYNVRLDIKNGDLPHEIAIHPKALQYILINLLTFIIHHLAGGQIRIRSWKEIFSMVIEVSFSAPNTLSINLSDSDRASIAVVEKLVDLNHGSIRFSLDQPPLKAIITLPNLESLSILVIDDNIDNIRLLERYLTNTRFSLTSLVKPEEVYNTIERTTPHIIILDLMMPGIDGLEILTQLHTHPTTSNLPTIVSSVLPQEELVLTLGATAFLPKPVTQEQLLACLDQLVSSLETKTG